jgi:hypothetical protein
VDEAAETLLRKFNLYTHRDKKVKLIASSGR